MRSYRVICTRRRAATDTHGTRIVASDADGHRITVPYDYSLNPLEMHRQAAKLLLEKLQRSGRLLGGSAPGSGYCFIVKQERSKKRR